MNHPMMYVAMNEDRISNPVILEIDPEVIYDEDTKYADMNAVRNGAHVVVVKRNNHVREEFKMTYDSSKAK